MFDEAAANALINSVTSHAASLGIFRSVNSHEPKSAPGNGLRYAVWIDTIMPDGTVSGLDMVSGTVTLIGRIYGNMLQKPEDEVDPRITAATASLMTAYAGNFTFSGSIRDVDLLRMNAKAGYVTIASTVYRVMDISIPCVINDMWSEVA
jgi:hypothetical protein